MFMFATRFFLEVCTVSVSFTTLTASSGVNIQGALLMSTTLTPERIGNNLKHLIKESEYRTQEAFAEAVGADVRTVRRWVQNGIDSIFTVAMVADVLDVDEKALLF
jgi:hypothetical protein